jgi:hypothetical protein
MPWMSGRPNRLTDPTPLLCLGCRTVGPVSGLRARMACPACGGTRFLRHARTQAIFTVIDLAAHRSGSPNPRGGRGRG